MFITTSLGNSNQDPFSKHAPKWMEVCICERTGCNFINNKTPNSRTQIPKVKLVTSNNHLQYAAWMNFKSIMLLKTRYEGSIYPFSIIHPSIYLLINQDSMSDILDKSRRTKELRLSAVKSWGGEFDWWTYYYSAVEVVHDHIHFPKFKQYVLFKSQLLQVVLPPQNWAFEVMLSI